MKKRQIIAAAMAGVMVLSATACSSGSSSQSTTAAGDTAAAGESAGSTGGQTLTVLLSEEPNEGDALTMMLNNWAEETGNTLDVQIIAYDDQLTKFPSMAKNNDLPDLIATTRLHQLYPDEFVDMSQYFDTSMFEESALKIVGKDYVSDKITGLPYNFTTTCVFYNADAFEAC